MKGKRATAFKGNVPVNMDSLFGPGEALADVIPSRKKHVPAVIAEHPTDAEVEPFLSETIVPEDTFAETRRPNPNKRKMPAKGEPVPTAVWDLLPRFVPSAAPYKQVGAAWAGLSAADREAVVTNLLPYVAATHLAGMEPPRIVDGVPTRPRLSMYNYIKLRAWEQIQIDNEQRRKNRTEGDGGPIESDVGQEWYATVTGKDIWDYCQRYAGPDRVKQPLREQAVARIIERAMTGTGPNAERAAQHLHALGVRPSAFADFLTILVNTHKGNWDGETHVH